MSCRRLRRSPQAPSTRKIMDVALRPMVISQRVILDVQLLSQVCFGSFGVSAEKNRRKGRQSSLGFSFGWLAFIGPFPALMEFGSCFRCFHFFKITRFPTSALNTIIASSHILIVHRVALPLNCDIFTGDRGQLCLAFYLPTFLQRLLSDFPFSRSSA